MGMVEIGCVPLDLPSDEEIADVDDSEIEIKFKDEEISFDEDEVEDIGTSDNF